MDEQNLWSLGSSSGFSGEFNPSSLNGLLEDGSLGSLTGSLKRERDAVDDMDIDNEDFIDDVLPDLTGLPPRKSVFPDHPGPVVPLRPSQVFEQPLTPNMSVSQATMTLLNKIYQFQSAQRGNLDKLRLAQLQVLSRPNPQALLALYQQEEKMRNDTTAALQALVHVWCGCLLSPMEIWRWDFLYSDLQVQYVQISLYLDELRAFKGQAIENASNCAIAIISQPFPVVATRGRAVDGHPMVVQLLTGATVDVINTTQVKAEAIIPKGTKGKLAPDLMDKQLSPLHPETKHAEFRLKFANGTRKQPVMFQFQVQVNLGTMSGPRQFNVTSLPTFPTISVTNEVQWEEAEGILIEKMAFTNSSEVCPWFSLANYLQKHIIEASRQSVTELQRIFSLVELTYFHRSFFNGGSQVHIDSLREWWKWYGKAVHKIRYTKHVLSLFLNGHLFGFISKQDMEKALVGRPPGTFMVRFSERNPGSFSIAYVTQDPANPLMNMVRHYLVSHEDITQRKSLADFIGESPALTHFLRYDTKSGFNLAPTPMGPSVHFELQEKHSALAEYYAKREAIQHTSGYDSHLNPQPPMHVFQQNLNQSGTGMDGSSVLNHGMGLPSGSSSPSLGGFRSVDNLADDYFDAE